MIRVIEYLVDIDKGCLLAINGINTPWADSVMWYISKPWFWFPLYAILIGLLIWQFGWKKGFLFVLLLFAAVGLSDWVSSGLIKHWVCRLRPTHEPSLEGLVHVVNNYVGGLYGFVSSHAANTMSLALLFSLIWRQKNNHGWWLMIFVVLNCYSRIYLGVHYPIDILGGLVVGIFIALLIYFLLYLLMGRDKQHVNNEVHREEDL